MGAAPVFSVVVPVFNEETVIAELYRRLTRSLDGIRESYEMIFVNDGSGDQSLSLLCELTRQDGRVKVVNFSRNFGHQAALQAGLDGATGKAVILMDADLQDPPEMLGRFVELWRQGYEVVYAVRRKRKETFLKRAGYALFYRTMKAIAEIDVPLNAGDFCLLDRSVVDTLAALPERNRFLRGLRSWVGFKQVGVEYEREARHAGVPKYTLRKLIRLALSGYIGFSAMPLRAAVWLGFLSAGTGFTVALWVLITKLMDIPSPRGWASTVALILFVGGIQLLMLGIIGEYVGRVYDEVRQRPLYIVHSRLGFPPVRATMTGDDLAAPAARPGDS
ncbi:MAG: glycosyltransferase family 2 protein [Candidatus Binatia bacterium]